MPEKGSALSLLNTLFICVAADLSVDIAMVLGVTVGSVAFERFLAAQNHSSSNAQHDENSTTDDNPSNANVDAIQLNEMNETAGAA